MDFETFRDVDASDAPTRRGGFVLRKRVLIMKNEAGLIVDKTRLFDGLFLTFRVKRRCKRMLRNYNRANAGIAAAKA